MSAVHRPFSYRVAIGQFPIVTAVWGLDGKPVATIADLKLADDVPVDFDAVRTGRRAIAWRADAPATLCWVEARDGGDPKQQIAVRDEVSCAAAPFARPTRLAGLAHRYAGILWGDGALALITEQRWKDRKTITTILAPDAPATPHRVLWDRSYEDRYSDPGDPIMRRTPSGKLVLHAVVQLGVGDRDRFAVGGHSYGAFTTANLLAHSKLFRTGIARSGAYNRTLTPFGFQSEERTYWEAASTYDQMSPFRFADKIDAPLLLVHGAADNNTGTFPIQTERLYAAMQGLGARVRYVSLPAEAHGYRARESALHVLWEQTRWLETHLKNAPPRDSPATPGKPPVPPRPAQATPPPPRPR